ncbi:MAG TPA: MarR family winged helix-turn-helix transcriptional regulator [Ideonella sp.]|nr:MarR family winged helix-turn-helix transcriptional regulator [Ideonella sp.]
MSSTVTLDPVLPAAVPAETSPRARGCTGLRLRSLTRLVTRHYDAALAAAGLRLTQYTLLSYLKSSGEIAHTALAHALGMDRTTLTRNLRPLVEAGWIAQQKSSTDARATTLSLTDAGHQQWQQARPLWRTAQDSLNDTLGHQRVIDLHRLLEDSIEILSSGEPRKTGA